MSKIPSINPIFWLSALISAVLGETAADWLKNGTHWGVNKTFIIMGVIGLIVIVFQILNKSYSAGMFWLTMVLAGIIGTLFSDMLRDTAKASLMVTTIIFIAGVVITLLMWKSQEKSVSPDSVSTTSQGAYFWITSLFAFSLGTASGDQVATRFNTGFIESTVIFAAIILVIWAIGKFANSPVASFWLTFVLIRPLGANIGDLFGKGKADSGLNFGTLPTSIVFIILLVAVVFSQSRKKA
jgi:uncharacterized membrane-anchored protein